MGMSPRGIGFGLGVQVVGDPVAADRRVSKGAWGWAGAYGTNVHIEPQEKMVTIIFMQTSTPALQRDFEQAVFLVIVMLGRSGPATHAVRPRDALFEIGRSGCRQTTCPNWARTVFRISTSNNQSKGGAPARGNAPAPLIATRRSELRAGLTSV